MGRVLHLLCNTGRATRLLIDEDTVEGGELCRRGFTRRRATVVRARVGIDIESREVEEEGE